MNSRVWYPGKLALFAVICTWLPAISAPAADLKAVLQGVVTTYAQIATYQDSGVVLTHDTTKDQPDEILFRTRFERSGHFRFDWISHHPYPPLRHLKTSAVIWTDASGAHFFTDYPSTQDTLKDFANLNEISKAAMGVSRRASFHVPRLLAPEITGSSVLDLADLTLVGDDVFEGVLCHRIKGTASRGGACEIWVGQADFLIRRIVRTETATLSNGRPIPPTEEIHREIVINAKIPAVDFQVKT